MLFLLRSINTGPNSIQTLIHEFIGTAPEDPGEHALIGKDQLGVFIVKSLIISSADHISKVSRGCDGRMIHRNSFIIITKDV